MNPFRVKAWLAFIVWGLFPLYLKLLGHLKAYDQTFYRVFFAALILGVYFIFQSKKIQFHKLMFLSAALIAINWFGFVYAISSERTYEASIGYFTSPLLTMLIGSIIHKENLKKREMLSLSLFVVGLVSYFLFSDFFHFPYLSLGLALSFSLYSLVKKNIKQNSLSSVWFESLMISAAMALYSLPMPQTQDLGLLIGLGGLTILPLLLFSQSAPHMSMTELGMIQALAPLLHAFLSLIIFKEKLGLAFSSLLLCSFLSFVTYQLWPYLKRISQYGWK